MTKTWTDSAPFKHCWLSLLLPFVLMLTDLSSISADSLPLGGANAWKSLKSFQIRPVRRGPLYSAHQSPRCMCQDLTLRQLNLKLYNILTSAQSKCLALILICHIKATLCHFFYHRITDFKSLWCYTDCLRLSFPVSALCDFVLRVWSHEKYVTRYSTKSHTTNYFTETGLYFTEKMFSGFPPMSPGCSASTLSQTAANCSCW